MKAILIDAYNKQVKELTLDPTEPMLDQWYEHMQCDLVTVAHYINDHDSILVDDEGLLKPCDHFFHYEGGHQPFAGSGMVVGTDEDGETVSCKISVEDVAKNVTFYSRQEVIDGIEANKF